MLRITVELVPFGIGEPKTIASMKLWNDGTGDRKIGNYKFNLFGKRQRLMKMGEIKNFSRLQDHV